MPIKDGNSSAFCGKSFEFMKSPYLGEKGHVAVSCNDVGRALAFLKSKGIGSLPETERKKDGRTAAIYLDLNIGGFIFHLLQK
jgi:2-dehydro-3-deoxyphosphogluconate aldolase/(4S)-4-hydroxy-2-oxoglutarate aldolase